MKRLMKKKTYYLAIVWLALSILRLTATIANGQTAPSKKIWIDSQTGHRVVRLAVQPGSRTLYFNYQAATPDGQMMIYVAQRSIYLYKIASEESKLLVPGPISWTVVGEKTGLVYYAKIGDSGLYSANPKTGELRRLLELPPRALPHTINADETILAGTYIEGSMPDLDKIKVPSNIRPSRAAEMELRRRAKIPMALFTIGLPTGKLNVILRTDAWLNHVEFSPTRPDLLMYCHEGLWQDVDRIWTIHADGTGNTLIHPKDGPMDVTGHEFWGPDGKTIWYDLQKPKGKNFFLANFNVDSGKTTEFRLRRNQWSTHFNISPDGRWAAGDGGDAFQVANASDGAWIQLFKLPGLTEPPSDPLHVPLPSERLVNLSSHRYSLEPNVRFSKDSKQVIFTSNMEGGTYIYAVDVNGVAGEPSFTDSPRAAIAMEENDPPAQIVIENTETSAPIKNASVTISSLDGRGQLISAITDGSGRLAPFVAEQGLYQILIHCPDQNCNDAVIERFAWQLSGKVVFKLAGNKEDANSFAIPQRSVELFVHDQDDKPLSGIQILMRDLSATHQRWYTTDSNGSVRVQVEVDPAIMVVLFERNPLIYRLAQNCSAKSSSSWPCIVVQDMVHLVVSDPTYRNRVINR